MQSALRSATRRAVGISSRRGVAATTTTTKAATATAREPERDWLWRSESEKAWVTALVQREVRAQMLAEEERRIMRERDRDRLRAAVEEWPFRARLIPLWADYTLAAMEGWVLGAGLAILLYGR